jgi:hypothetical protein
MSRNAHRVTRRVRPEDLAGLLRQPPRACLAFARDGAVEAMPVAFHRSEARYLVGLPEGGSPPLDAPVRLLIDDGYHYFDLRGVWAIGRLTPCAAPALANATGLEWFEVVVEKAAAWNYGTMRATHG